MAEAQALAGRRRSSSSRPLPGVSVRDRRGSVRGAGGDGRRPRRARRDRAPAGRCPGGPGWLPGRGADAADGPGRGTRSRSACSCVRAHASTCMTMPPGRGRHLPRPLHRLGRSQRAAAPARAAAGLVASRSTGWSRCAARRAPPETSAAHLRDRGRPVRASSAWPRSRRSCARIAARSRPRRRGRLPALVRRADLRGDCHSHSDWSDGREPLETMAESARRGGRQYQVLTDHSRSLTIANGLSPARVEQQRRIIGELNERFAREEAAGELPEGAASDGFRLLHGCELEITARRPTGLRRRAAGPLRRGGGVAARRPPSAARAAHGALRAGPAQPARRHHQPPIGAQDRAATGPRPRLGGLLPRWPRRRARCWRSTAARQRLDLDEQRIRAALTRAAASPSTPTPTTGPSGGTRLGRGHGASWLAGGRHGGQHAASRRLPGADAGEAAPPAGLNGCHAAPASGRDAAPGSGMVRFTFAWTRRRQAVPATRWHVAPRTSTNP